MYRIQVKYLEHLQKYLQKYHKYGINLNSKKYTFVVTLSILFDHIIYKKGLQVDLTKIQAIIALLPPKYLKRMCEFIDSISYYWRFVHNFTNISQVLKNLIKSNIKYI